MHFKSQQAGHGASAAACLRNCAATGLGGIIFGVQDFTDLGIQGLIDLRLAKFLTNKDCYAFAREGPVLSCHDFCHVPSILMTWPHQRGFCWADFHRRLMQSLAHTVSSGEGRS